MIELWQAVRARNPVARVLVIRHILWLLIVMPMTTAIVTWALFVVPVELDIIAYAVLGAVLVAVVACAVVAVVGGVARALAVGVVFGSVFGVEFGALFGMNGSVEVGATDGVVLGMASGVALGLMIGVACGVAIDEAISTRSGVTATALAYLACGTALGVLGGVVDNVWVLVSGSVASGLAIGAAAFHLPHWLAESTVTRLLALMMRRRPDETRWLSSWLPFRHHDLIHLPLPGLHACLVLVAEADPALGEEFIALAAESSSQRRIARLAQFELQARTLERAARGRLFARTAGLDFPFLPREMALTSDPVNAPLIPFLNAARDLIAGSANQRQRRLALERARSSLEGFRVITAGSNRPAPLARRLLSTAALWLDVIREEAAELARRMADHPEVPSAFIAGPPLTPERAEDRTLFKGRADIIKLIAHDLAPDRRGVVLVIGQRRMGKTSLCNYLPGYLGTGTLVVASNFQALSGDVYREAPHRRILRDITMCLGSAPSADFVRWGEGLSWLEHLDRVCTDRRILVVIDEIERVEDGIRAGWCSTDFLDFLRAAGDALRNIRFLLLTAYPLHRLGPHWTDRLVSITSRMISYLDEDDARELLVHPISEFPDIYPEGGIDRIIVMTGRHPYLLQKAGDDLCRLLNSRGSHRATADELTEVFDGMVRDVHVFDEIWRSRNDIEQRTLCRLAESEEPGVLDPGAISLIREGYVERRGDKVAIVVPLFREWIRMNHVR